jgi:hypothetical protein
MRCSHPPRQVFYVERLRGRSSRGLGGWHTEKKRNAKYREELIKQFREGNSIEVLRLAAIIMAREQLLGPDA